MGEADSPIVVVGAGAVGSLVGGWLAQAGNDVRLVARGEHAEAMARSGLKLRCRQPAGEETAPVQVARGLDDCPPAGTVILAVKNYDLEQAAADVKLRYGGAVPVVALQNGLYNQEVLPRFFSRVVYGVVWFSATRPEPGVAGFKYRGPISLGPAAPNPTLDEHLRRSHVLLSSALECEIAGDFQAAMRTKMILNLTNSLMTLVGHTCRPIDKPRLLKRLTVGLLLEGIRVVEAQGYREYRRGDNPSWRLLKASARLPEFVTDRIFEADLAKLALNSMGQDVLQFHKGATELDSLNGYFVAQGRRLGLSIPFNETAYELCRAQFARPDFAPMSEEEVWTAVRAKIIPGRR